MAALLVPRSAEALRFSLGVAAVWTPLVVDSAVTAGDGYRSRYGLRPVLDVEIFPWLAAEAYAPFVLLRTGDGDGAASSGAESLFGVGLSGRLRSVAGADETLLYSSVRGGFSVIEGAPGPFLGVALGYASTSLVTSRGWFAELEAGHVGVTDRHSTRADVQIDRWLVGATIGVVFRLGGEKWDL